MVDRVRLATKKKPQHQLPKVAGKAAVPLDALPPERKKGTGRGRHVGSVNKIPAELKSVMMEAYAKLGEDGKGKNGAIGYFMRLFQNYPEWGGRLAEKLLPMMVASPAGQAPVQVFNVPPEVLKKLSSDQLNLLMSILAIMGGQPGDNARVVTGDAAAYMKELGLEGMVPTAPTIIDQPKEKEHA